MTLSMRCGVDMKTNRFNTAVKYVSNQRYEIGVLKDQDDMYCVAYYAVGMEDVHHGEQLTDYNMATFLFDLKFAELEGQ